MNLGWVDFTPEEREGANAALEALREPGAVDEMGIGAVRDAFADRFFPGTSTQQTKPKYFVLVPRAVRAALELAADGRVRDSAFDELRRQEFKCAEALWNSVGRRVGRGVIGGTRLNGGSPRHWIASPPSAAYWSGLRTFGIVTAPEGESLRAFLAAREDDARAASGRRRMSVAMLNEEEGVADDAETGIACWRLGFSIPSDVLGDLSHPWDDIAMELTKAEAAWLRDCIVDSGDPRVSRSLLAISLREGVRIPAVNNNAWTGWVSPFEAFCRLCRPCVPDEAMRRLMNHACAFARLVATGRVLYNRALGKGEAATLWHRLVPGLSRQLDFDVPAAFAMLGLNNHGDESRFLIRLQSVLRRGREDAAVRLLREREVAIKGKDRAKLANPGRAEKRDWIGGLWLDFRLLSAREIVEDIADSGMLTGGRRHA